MPELCADENSGASCAGSSLTARGSTETLLLPPKRSVNVARFSESGSQATTVQPASAKRFSEDP